MSAHSGKGEPDSADNSQKETKSLSFFTADDNETSSESENEEESCQTHEPTTTETSNANKLPSPSTLFATVGKPKFLETPLEQNDVDWNSLSKRYEPLFEYSSVSYPAETVDLESNERNEASISGAPIKYKTEISETKRHLFLHGKRSADLASVVDTPSTTQGMVKYGVIPYFIIHVLFQYLSYLLINDIEYMASLIEGSADCVWTRVTDFHKPISLYAQDLKCTIQTFHSLGYLIH